MCSLFIPGGVHNCVMCCFFPYIAIVVSFSYRAFIESHIFLLTSMFLFFSKSSFKFFVTVCYEFSHGFSPEICGHWLCSTLDIYMCHILFVKWSDCVCVVRFLTLILNFLHHTRSIIFPCLSHSRSPPALWPTKPMIALVSSLVSTALSQETRFIPSNFDLAFTNMLFWCTFWLLLCFILFYVFFSNPHRMILIRRFFRMTLSPLGGFYRDPFLVLLFQFSTRKIHTKGSEMYISWGNFL